MYRDRSKEVAKRKRSESIQAPVTQTQEGGGGILKQRSALSLRIFKVECWDRRRS